MKTLRECINLIESVEQGDEGGSGQKFKVYYAYIDYDEWNTERVLPDEFDLYEEIVIADSAQDAINKFKRANPDAYVDSAEPLQQGVSESELEETREDPVARVEQLAQEILKR